MTATDTSQADPRQALIRRARRGTASGLLLLLVACGGEEPRLEGRTPVDDGPVQITYDYRTTQTREGVRQWELHGGTALRFPGQTSIQLEGVRMRFYEEGELKAVLTSRTGEIEEESRNTVARGDVELLTQDGRTLHSEVLHWDNQRQLIHSEEFVRYAEGDQILTGYGMETDPDLSNLTLRERVAGELPADKRPQNGRESP